MSHSPFTLNSWVWTVRWTFVMFIRALKHQRTLLSGSLSTPSRPFHNKTCVGLCNLLELSTILDNFVGLLVLFTFVCLSVCLNRHADSLARTDNHLWIGPWTRRCHSMRIAYVILKYKATYLRTYCRIRAFLKTFASFLTLSSQSEVCVEKLRYIMLNYC